MRGGGSRERREGRGRSLGTEGGESGWEEVGWGWGGGGGGGGGGVERWMRG